VTRPIGIGERDEVAPFEDAGPHRVITRVAAPSTLRGGFGVRIFVKDLDTAELLYHGYVTLTIYDASAVDASSIQEYHAATGWSGNVTLAPAIVSEEVVIDFTIPAGHTVEISYAIEGGST
jgi:hypothetical protein